MYFKCDKYRDFYLSEVKHYVLCNNLKITLSIIRVGDDYASGVYVKNKVKICESVGINVNVFTLPENSTQEKIISVVEKLNEDNSVNGILVQLPLPKNIDEDKVVNSISPKKDVDCLTPTRMGEFYMSPKLNSIADFSAGCPCTVMGIMIVIACRLGTKNKENLNGLSAVVIGRSNIVGRPAAAMLEKLGATVTLCHSLTPNIADYTRKADIIVVAVGKENFLTVDMVKDGATVFDIGINRNSEGKVCDDVAKEVAERADVSAVPGGMGIMTTASVAVSLIGLVEREG